MPDPNELSPTPNRIASWNGQAWSKFGSGIEGDYPTIVNKLLPGDDDSVYVGGTFALSGGKVASHLARFDMIDFKIFKSDFEGVAP